ncbi:type II secretion system protein [Marinobacter zhanjiangensis]|uniref:type II secretion system protein n=1 Tax=Marinobacter zhanjiangensis TaxID=578215 RepID=UPI003570C5A5
MVIILIGILSALGVGLLTRSSSFSPLLATQQLESATLLAQQAALAGNSSNSLTISQTTKDFQFQAGGSSFGISREGASITYRREDQSSYQAIGASGLTIGFDSFGRVNSPVAMMGYQFRISGDSNYQICLSPLGAIYRGGC